MDINSAWETGIKISAKESLGYYELKKQKPPSDNGCSEFLDQRKQAISMVTGSKRNKKGSAEECKT
jgi:hypothetical protein